jgi:hypothetical protein
MSDRINPQGPRLRADFRPSYRPEKPGADLNDLRRIGIVAAGLAGIVALSVGGMKLLGQRHEGVPTVEAPAGPVRVKPLDAGGLKLTGAELSAGPDGAQQALGPAAEQPEINALRAQLHAVKQELARQAAENAQTAKIAETAKIEASTPKIVVTPAPVQASALAHEAPVPPPLPVSVPPVEQRVHVQLAAFADSAAAYTEWDTLVKKWPDLLARRRPEISRVAAAGRTMWRLRTGPFPDVADARSFCATLRNRGADCSVAAF